MIEVPSRALLLRAAVYVIASIAYLAPLLAHPAACIFGLHDWTWPCFGAQSSTVVATLTSLFSQQNLGLLQPRPLSVVAVMPFVYALPLGSQEVLRASLLVFLALAAIGADVAAARIFAVRSPLARLAAGLIYLGSPFVLVKFVSGHLFFVLALALMPFALTTIASIGDRAVRWIPAALLVSTAFVQVQVGILLCLSLPFFVWRRDRLLQIASIWIFCIIVFLPQGYGTIASFASGSLIAERQVRAFIENNSVPIWHLFDGTAYFTHYFDTVAPPVSTLAWTIAGVVSILLGLMRSGSPRRLAIAVLLCGAAAAGTNAPYGPIYPFLMTNFAPTAIFRDFYDLLVFVPLLISGAVAYAIDSLARRSAAWASPARGAIALAVCMLIGLLDWPSLSGAAARMVPQTSTGTWDAQVAQVAARSGDDRVMWLPNAAPLGPPGTPGGVDVFWVQVGSHPSATAYHPTGIFAYASALADQTGSLPDDLARRLGIGDIETRIDVVGRRLENTGHPIAHAFQWSHASSHTVEGAGPVAFSIGQAACEPPLRSLMRDNLSYRRCPERPVALPQEADGDSDDDIATNWVSAQRWTELDEKLADPIWPVLATRSKKPYRFTLTRSAFTLVYAAARVVVDGQALAGCRCWKFVRLKAGAHELAGDGHGTVALSASLERGTRIAHFRAQGAERAVDVRQADRIRGKYTLNLPAHAMGMLILRDGYLDGWRLRIDGSAQNRKEFVDGYAVGWPLTATTHATELSIDLPAVDTQTYLAIVSGLIWFALLLLWIADRRSNFGAKA